MTILLLSRKAEGVSNPYKLPRGEKLRREVVGVFEEQRKAIIRYLRTGAKDGVVDHRPDPAGPARLDGARGDRVLPRATLGRSGLSLGPGQGRKDQAPPVPLGFPGWDDFGLGALKISERMTPILTLTWEAAADAFAPRVGLDPNAWSVVNPETARMIEEAALAFCESTNETTSLALDEALSKLRDELNQGIVDVGESLDLLTQRVNAIFDTASTSRARRIAWTETSRAVHSAQEQAAIHSGVVTGWKWLASGDACPTCVAIAARTPFVRLGQPFAVIGSDPHYSTIKFPPAHPHCMCSMLEVLDTDEQPHWGDTLHDPDPATEEEQDRIGAELADQSEGILNPAGSGGLRGRRGAPSKRMRPVRRPVPLARKRLRRLETVA